LPYHDTDTTRQNIKECNYECFAIYNDYIAVDQAALISDICFCAGNTQPLITLPATPPSNVTECGPLNSTCIFKLQQTPEYIGVYNITFSIDGGEIFVARVEEHRFKFEFPGM